MQPGTAQGNRSDARRELDDSLAIRLPADIVEALGLKEGDEVELRIAGLRDRRDRARDLAERREAALAVIKDPRWKLRPRDNRRVDALERLAGGERYAVVGGHAARHAHRRHAPHRQPVLRHVLNAIILFLQLGYQSLKSRYMRFQRVREQPQICSRWQVLPDSNGLLADIGSDEFAVGHIQVDHLLLGNMAHIPKA